MATSGTKHPFSCTGILGSNHFNCPAQLNLSSMSRPLFPILDKADNAIGAQLKYQWYWPCIARVLLCTPDIYEIEKLSTLLAISQGPLFRMTSYDWNYCFYFLRVLVPSLILFISLSTTCCRHSCNLCAELMDIEMCLEHYL